MPTQTNIQQTPDIWRPLDSGSGLGGAFPLSSWGLGVTNSIVNSLNGTKSPQNGNWNYAYHYNPGPLPSNNASAPWPASAPLLVVLPPVQPLVAQKDLVETLEVIPGASGEPSRPLGRSVGDPLQQKKERGAWGCCQIGGIFFGWLIAWLTLEGSKQINLSS